MDEEILDQETKYDKLVAAAFDTQIHLNKALDELDVKDKQLDDAAQLLTEKEDIIINKDKIIEEKEKNLEEKEKNLEEKEKNIKELEKNISLLKAKLLETKAVEERKEKNFQQNFEEFTFQQSKLKKREEELRNKELLLMATEKRLRELHASISKSVETLEKGTKENADRFYKSLAAFPELNMEQDSKDDEAGMEGSVAFDNGIKKNLIAKEIVTADSSECSMTVCALDPRQQGDFELMNDSEKFTSPVINPRTGSSPTLTHVSSESGTVQKPVTSNEIKELKSTRHLRRIDDYYHRTSKLENAGSTNSQSESRTLCSDSDRRIIQEKGTTGNGAKRVKSMQLAEYGQEMEDHSQEMEDHGQEMEDYGQEMEDRSQEMEDDTQEMEDHSQEMADGTRELGDHMQEMRDHTQEMRGHTQEMGTHTQEMTDHSNCVFVSNGVKRTHSECENKFVLSHSKSGTVRKTKLSCEIQKRVQLPKSPKRPLNTESVSNSTLSRDCSLRAVNLVGRFSNIATCSPNSQINVDPNLHRYFVPIAKLYEKLQKRKSLSLYDKAVKYSSELFKFMNTLGYPALDTVCYEIIVYFDIFWWECPKESFPASSDFENVLRMDERAFVRGAELVLQEGLEIQSSVIKFLDYILHFIKLSEVDIMCLKSLVRVYTALCKHISDKVKVRTLIFTLLKRDKIALYLVAVIASIWPEVLHEIINLENDHILTKVISYVLFTKPAELDNDLWNYSVYVFQTLCKLSTSLDYSLTFLLDKLISAIADHGMSSSPFEADKNILTAIFILIGRQGWAWAFKRMVTPYLVTPLEKMTENPRILTLHLTILADLALEFNKTDEILEVVEKFMKSPYTKALPDYVKVSGTLATNKINARLSEKTTLPQKSPKTTVQ